MATETLEDNKPQPEPPLQGENDDVAAPEPKPEPDKAEPPPEAEQKDDSAEITKSEKKNVEEDKADEKTEEKDNEDDDEHDDVDAVENDDEEVDEDEAEIEEGDKEGQSNSKTPKKVSKSEASEKEGGKEKDPVTPVSDRPTRERKMVERYSIPSPSKYRRSSSSKGFPIEKGRGAQLKDIPNVAFKLSKRKPDDNLHMLHSILFGKKTKAYNLKRNIGQFSGYLWVENEDKQRAKVKERIDKCVKEKLMDCCDVLNIPINKGNVKKEELSAKLLEFLESPHATTDVLLADKEQKGKKRTRKVTPNKSSGEASIETSAKKQKRTSQVGKKRKQLSDNEDDKAQISDAKDESQEDVTALPNKESQSEEDKPKAHKRTPKKIVKEGSVAKAEESTPSVKKTSVKASKSNEKTPKKSSSKKTVTGSTSASSKSKQPEPASKKQRTVKGKQDNKGKAASKKQTDKSSKALVKNQGKGKRSKKAKVAEPCREEMHAVVVDILKEVDFNTATLSDILRQLGTHFGLDLMHRKAEVKDIITDVINNMSDEEAENDGDVDADKDDDGGDSDDA